MKEVEESYIRGVQAIKDAEAALSISLPMAASRLYIAGENLAYSLLVAFHGASSRNHGKIWNGIQKLYDSGNLGQNYKELLESSYRMRLQADYGRKTEIALDKETLEKQIASLKNFAEEVKAVLKERGFIL
ncbi:MAG: hypothetical protein HYX24_01880 [Candidatus Aenigmarchaeota archaeon]|nr:hypothetical protein [Candidatus Aenigmarchaeota archaeon]